MLDTTGDAQQVAVPAQAPESIPLDNLLSESLDHAAATFSLDALLGESIALKDERDAEKELRKKIQRGGGSAAEIEADKALLRQWDRQREWKLKANVLVFTRQLCTACDSYHTTVEGRFELLSSNRIQSATKLQSVVVFSIPDLPREVLYHDALVTVCHDCADNDGWPLEEE